MFSYAERTTSPCESTTMLHLRAVCAVSVALLTCCLLAGCDRRGAYELEPAPPRGTYKAVFAAAEDAPPYPIVAETGDLLCHVEAGGTWDTSVLPFTGAEYADVEVRAHVGSRRARVELGESYGEVLFKQVSVKPQEMLRLQVFDIDQWFHDEIGTFALRLDGTWPVRFKNEHASGACVLLSPARTMAALKQRRAKLEGALDAFKKAFNPSLSVRYFGFYEQTAIYDLREEAEALAAQHKGAEAARLKAAPDELERWWDARARAVMKAELAKLPTPDNTWANPRFVMTAAAPSCDPKLMRDQYGAARLDHLWADKDSCLATLSLKNTSSASLEVSGRLDMRGALQLGDATCWLREVSADGKQREVIVNATQHEDAWHSTKEGAQTSAFAHTLKPGEAVTLLTSARRETLPVMLRVLCGKEERARLRVPQPRRVP